MLIENREKCKRLAQVRAEPDRLPVAGYRKNRLSVVGSRLSVDCSWVWCAQPFRFWWPGRRWDRELPEIGFGLRFHSCVGRGGAGGRSNSCEMNAPAGLRSG